MSTTDFMKFRTNLEEFIKVRCMSNFGHFLSPGGGAMSMAEYQHMNGFKAGLLSYM